MQQVWGISRSLAAFHVNNLSTFIVTDVTLLLWVISPLTALKQCYAQCFESNHTRLLHTVCLSWLYYSTTTLCMHVCYVSRLISLSHRASLTSQLCLFVSPWVGGGVPKPYSNPAWEKALEKNSWKPTWESVGRRTSNTLENVRAIFSCLIILKCSGWLRTSTVNYAHYTSELL